MDESELVEFLFEQLVEGVAEHATGILLSPVSLFTRFVDWLDEDNPVHQRAAAKAIDKYKKSGFCSDFRSDFRS